MSNADAPPTSLATVPLVGVAVNAAFVGITIGLVGGPGWEPADDWAALVACVVIACSGLGLLVMAVRELLDAAPAGALEQRVRDLAGGVAGVRALDKCRIRKSGTRSFVELHVEVDGEATVREGHDIGGRVRGALRGSPLRIADASIHIEPARRSGVTTTADPGASPT